MKMQDCPCTRTGGHVLQDDGADTHGRVGADLVGAHDVHVFADSHPVIDHRFVPPQGAGAPTRRVPQMSYRSFDDTWVA
jgi:hypothetical protein